MYQQLLPIPTHHSDTLQTALDTQTTHDRYVRIHCIGHDTVTQITYILRKSSTKPCDTSVSARISNCISTYQGPYRNLYRERIVAPPKMRYGRWIHVRICRVSMVYRPEARRYVYRGFDTPDARYIRIRSDTQRIRPIRLWGNLPPIHGETSPVPLSAAQHNTKKAYPPLDWQSLKI